MYDLIHIGLHYFEPVEVECIIKDIAQNSRI